MNHTYISTRKAFALAILLFIFPQSLFAQNQTGDAHSLLWRISGKDLKKPSYLFGTIHAICRDDFFLPSKILKSIDSCEKICFELNIHDPAIISEAVNSFNDNSGKLLRDYFTKEQYDTVHEYFKDSLHVDIDTCQHKKLVFLQVKISRSVTGCKHPVSYEDSIMEIGLKKHKTIMGIESVAEEMGAIDDGNPDSTVSQILKSISYTKIGITQLVYTLMVFTYKTQDISLLYKISSGNKASNEFMSKVVTVRNKRWISRIEETMHTSSALFAFGAGHLWGDKGVIELLRKEGYTVEPLR